MKILEPSIFAFIQKSTQALLGFITASFIIKYMTPEDQGYYYTIGSILNLQIFFDLGLSNLLVFISARNSIGIDFNRRDNIRTESGEKFLQFYHHISKIYYKQSGLITALFPIGFIYFYFSSNQSSWILPFAIAVIGVSINQTQFFKLNIIEGLKKINEAYQLRTIIYILSNLISWIIIRYGFGIYSAGILYFVSFFIILIWSKIKYSALNLSQTNNSAFELNDSEKKMRIKSLFSISSQYIILNSPTLISFYTINKEISGKIGVSMIILNSLSIISNTLITSHSANFTINYRQISFKKYKQNFLKIFKINMGIVLLSKCALVIFIYAIQDNFLNNRILELKYLLILSLIFFTQIIYQNLLVFYRSQNNDNLSKLYLYVNILCIFLSLCLANKDNIIGLFLGFLIPQIIFLIHLISILFKIFKDDS